MSLSEHQIEGLTKRTWRVRLQRRTRHVLRPAQRWLGLLPPGARHVVCGLGHRHWGAFGAAGALVIAEDTTGSPCVLLGLRSTQISFPGTWGIPGGGRDSAEEPFGTAAYRELAEETGLDLSRLDPFGESVVDHGGWQYRTVLVHYRLLDDEMPAVKPLDIETVEFRWVPLGEVLALPLQPGFAKFWAGRMREGVL